MVWAGVLWMKCEKFNEIVEIFNETREKLENVWIFFFFMKSWQSVKMTKLNFLIYCLNNFMTFIFCTPSTACSPWMECGKWKWKYLGRRRTQFSVIPWKSLFFDLWLVIKLIAVKEKGSEKETDEKILLLSQIWEKRKLRKQKFNFLHRFSLFASWRQQRRSSYRESWNNQIFIIFHDVIKI